MYRGSVLLKSVSANASLVILNTTAYALVGSASPDVPLLLPNGTSPGTVHVDAAVSRAVPFRAVLCWVACAMLFYQSKALCVCVCVCARARACALAQGSAWVHAGGFSSCSHP